MKTRQNSPLSNGARRLGKYCLTALALLGAAVTTSANAQSIAPNNVLQDRLVALRRGAMMAWQTRDVPGLNKIMAPDFTFVSAGGAAPRDQWLAMLLRCSLGNYTMDQIQLNKSSNDSGILTYKLHYVGKCDGNSNSSDSMVVDTFIRRHRQWWIVNTAYMPQK